MPHTNQILARADGRTPVFACTATYGGLDAVWVYLAGELDIATTPQLEQALRESHSPARLTVLDLRELAFMDSAAVHTIGRPPPGPRARPPRHLPHLHRSASVARFAPAPAE
jgi:STAS domain